jgi:ATP-dependent Clp protease ATP-binding subunit ClpA
MARQGKRMNITEAAINRLVEQGFSPAYGARFLKRTIDEKVKLPITNLWKAFTGFVVDVVEGEVDVRGE